MRKLITLLCGIMMGATVYSQTWVQQANVPGIGRQGTVSFVIDGKIYVGGGKDSFQLCLNDFYQYDPATNLWTTKANLPDHIAGPTSLSFGGRGYCICGENDNQALATIYRYNPALDKWDTMAPFPGGARLNPVGVAIGDTGYIFGGYVGGQELNDLWAYNEGNDTWAQKASMPSVGRSTATGFVLNNIAYIGLGEYNSSANFASDIGAYNPATNTWSVIAQFPGHLRAGAIGFTLGGFGFVAFGGYDSSGIVSRYNDIYQYNPVSNAWTSAGYFPGEGRGSGVCLSVGDTIYVGSGEGNPNYPTDWWRYIYHININLGSAKTVCSGSSIILNPVVTGAIAPLTYSWSSTGDSLSCYSCQNPTVTITDSSTYTLTVTDANNTVTIDTISYFVSANTSALQLSLSNTGIKCLSPVDTTSAIISNGTSPVNYQWGDGTSITELNAASHTYNQPGTYIFSATDSLGCVISVFDTIPDSSVAVSIAQAVPPHCLNDSSGKIFLQVTGGTSPYTYKWTSGGSTTDSAIGLPPGDYEITVTDANSCSSQLFYELNPASDVWDYYVYLTGNDANCANNGYITANVYGGYGPYNFIWSNGDTTPTAQSLEAGTYYVTVTDSSGCPRTAGAIVNLYCISNITGTLFADTNQNCVLDSGELVLTNAVVSASTGEGDVYYGYTDWYGNYDIIVPGPGTYNLQVPELDYGYCANLTFCGNPSQNITIVNAGDSSNNNNFAATSTSGFDLTIHPGWTSADPGFQKEYWVMPYNQSAWPLAGNATVVFTYDSNLIYQYSLAPLPAVDTVAHTLTWVFSGQNIPSPFWDWYNFRFENFFLVPTTLDLGYLLQSDFLITPTTGDCDSSNNHLHFSETVIGSHDPNEKTVTPDGSISTDDSVLTYTIHFQNTGTDSTWFVVLVDTLSGYLNPATVRTIASSSPYSNFAVAGKGILTWTFNPLRLVDSITNAQGSKGFVTFTVKKFPNLPIGTVISNTANVFFDYNTGVVTNTVTDTVTLGSHPLSVKTVSPYASITVTAYPNPFNDLTHMLVNGVNTQYDFELYDVTGRLKRKIQSIQSNQFDLIRTDMADGVYFYRIVVNNEPVANGKIVVQ